MTTKQHIMNGMSYSPYLIAPPVRGAPKKNSGSAYYFAFSCNQFTKITTVQYAGDAMIGSSM